MNKYIRAILLLFLPSFVTKYILGIGRIGFSIILVENMKMARSSKVGHFNFIKCHQLEIDENASIGHLNSIKGYFDLILKEKSIIKNLNRLLGAKQTKCYCISQFILHSRAKVMSRHFFDLISSIEIGEKSIFAGASSQCWTHSYLYGQKNHARLDGKVVLGKNCYVGASCILLPGVKVGDNISLGAGTICSKSVSEPGLYVSSSIYHIPFNADDRIAALGQPMAVIDGIPRYRK